MTGLREGRGWARCVSRERRGCSVGASESELELEPLLSLMLLGDLGRVRRLRREEV